MKRIILTGGGTAGHVYPVMTIGSALKKNHRIRLIYVGTNSGPEREIAKKSEIPFFGIITGKRRQYLSFANFSDLLKVPIGLTQAFFLFLFYRPNLVFAKGGYVTFPIIFWAKYFKTPLVIHESDIVMGKANLMAAKHARKICLGFPIKYFFEYNKVNIPMEKLIYTGIPIREEFFNAEPNLVSNGFPKILITGGSQGSSKINDIVSEILPELTKKYEVTHLCGKRDYEDVKKKNGHQENYHLYEFTDEICKLMNEADLVISRAGANTLAEVSALGKASILIPLATASKDHQSVNAKVYQEANAAVMLSEKNLTSGSLLSIINHLMEDESFRKLIGHHAIDFSQKEATSEIVNLLSEIK